MITIFDCGDIEVVCFDVPIETIEKLYKEKKGQAPTIQYIDVTVSHYMGYRFKVKNTEFRFFSRDF